MGIKSLFNHPLFFYYQRPEIHNNLLVITSRILNQLRILIIVMFSITPFQRRHYLRRIMFSMKSSRRCICNLLFAKNYSIIMLQHFFNMLMMPGRRLLSYYYLSGGLCSSLHEFTAQSKSILFYAISRLLQFRIQGRLLWNQFVRIEIVIHFLLTLS